MVVSAAIAAVIAIISWTPRAGSAAADTELNEYMHLYTINRGI
jgi:hypothetical protein